MLQKKEDIEPNAVLPEVTDPIIPEKKPKGRPRKLKVDVPKAKALLAAGWSYEKIARSEFHWFCRRVKECFGRIEITSVRSNEVWTIQR